MNVKRSYRQVSKQSDDRHPKTKSHVSAAQPRTNECAFKSRLKHPNIRPAGNLFQTRGPRHQTTCHSNRVGWSTHGETRMTTRCSDDSREIISVHSKEKLGPDIAVKAKFPEHVDRSKRRISSWRAYLVDARGEVRASCGST